VLDIKWIRDNPDLLDAGLKKRNKPPCAAQLIDLDITHRDLLTQVQDLQSERNTVAKAFGEAKRKGESADELGARATEIKQLLASLEEKSTKAQNELEHLLAITPNMPRDEVPAGIDEADNELVKTWGDLPAFDFEPKRHFDLGEELRLMDFETAAKMSGSRFVILRGALAKMERALANFMLDRHIETYGYEEIQPPVLVKDQAFYGAGLLPKFSDNAFKTTEDHWLIPTSEVPLSNMVSDSIVEEKELPLRFVAHTPCFRSEAGAAGRDTRGMIRLHQFNKVELVSITHPDGTQKEHERIVSCAESILESLELPYRRMLLCGGDMGIQSEKTYDLEVWLPGENTYREISSCSTCGDYQARRMKARFRDEKTVDGKKAKPRLVNTLNGSGLAVGRTLVAVLENYQQADGSIMVPEVLRPYMGGLEKIEKR
tara:strand:- start:1245 stop:2534 length:1290 start_codon:yes stop_codon:yes gene_type:complete